MKIAIFASAFYPAVGGVEECCRQLAKCLISKGHPTIIITERWPRNLPEYELYEGIPVYRVPFRTPSTNLKSRISYPLTHLIIKNRVKRIIDQFKPDLLNIHCIGANAYYARLTKLSNHIPLVTTHHGDLSLFKGRLYLDSLFMHKEIQETVKESDYLTSCSVHTLNELIEYTNASTQLSTRAIINGINPKEFSTATPHCHPRSYILGLGRLIPKKGFDVLLRAFAQANIPNHDLILAGSGEEETSLKRLTKELGITDRVHFFGMANRQQAMALFKGCEFYVLPSRKEPQGIVLLEAMISQKAVIATNVGGIPEVLIDGETGILVPSEDPTALADAMKKMATDQETRERMATKGYQRSLDYDWENITNQYIEAYQEVLSSKR